MPIFVETFIEAPLDEVWRATQDPSVHQQWDLRFTEISYLPKETENAPQRFLYRTGPIRGEGESVGERELQDGTRASALRFWSGNAMSLILEGSGFWKYQPQAASVRFYTVYDYKTRFGIVGRLIDATVFRPLMAWATAWSFDRLRLWLERGVAPAAALRNALVHTIARTTLAIIWIYQGLVPKLLFPDSGERLLTTRLTGAALAPPLLMLAGVLEIVIGLALIVANGSRAVVWLSTIALVALTTAGLVSTPRIAVTPFNAVTLTLAMLALGIIVVQTMDDAPSALRTRWSSRKVPQ
jgi:uncharacterized membrane protein